MGRDILLFLLYFVSFVHFQLKFLFCLEGNEMRNDITHMGQHKRCAFTVTLFPQKKQKKKKKNTKQKHNKIKIKQI
jgi:hypothetical protein